MPWQRRVADVGLELVGGQLAYREIVVTLPRQSGKTTLDFAIEVDKCVSWDGPRRVIYTAQTGKDARKKLLEDHVPVLQASPLSGLVTNISRAAGAEAISFKDGSRIETASSMADAGHGFTVSLGVIEEAWVDEDDHREQALIPAMATIADAQLLVCSTAGTDESNYLRSKVDAGRHATEIDPGHGVAYFEWSAPQDADPTDERMWWETMPALGYTISLQAVRHALQTMKVDEFRRAWLNQWVDSVAERIIPDDTWQPVCDLAVAPEPPFVFGLDVLPDRSSGAIAVAGGGAVELVEHREGVGWMVSRQKQLSETYSAPVVVDGNGPAKSQADDLEAEGVTVVRLTNAEVAASCGRIYDDMADRRIRVRSHPDLNLAVEGLAKRPVGDRFVWSRTTSSADITPFMATTFAWEGYARPEIHRSSEPFAVVT